MKESPLFGVEMVEQGDHTGVIESFIAEPLADMSPIFLFDMGIIIFMISTASGKLNGLCTVSEVPKEMMI